MFKIYKYTNNVNGKVYIGQTRHTLEERAQKDGRNYAGSRKFYNAIQKYSWDAFVPEILAEVETEEEANKLEEYYIALYDSRNDDKGYNIKPGGDNHENSPETRALISKNAKERYKDKTKNPMYGRKHTEESKRKQSECKLGEKNPMYGRKWTDTQREKCSTKGKHLNLSDERRKALSELGKITGKKNAKPVICITDGIEFPSLKAASEYYDIPECTICDNLNGRSKLVRNKYVFEYLPKTA